MEILTGITYLICSSLTRSPLESFVSAIDLVTIKICNNDLYLLYDILLVNYDISRFVHGSHCTFTGVSTGKISMLSFSVFDVLMTPYCVVLELRCHIFGVVCPLRISYRIF